MAGNGDGPRIERIEEDWPTGVRVFVFTDKRRVALQPAEYASTSDTGRSLAVRRYVMMAHGDE